MPGCVIWPELVWCASASNLPPRRFSRRGVHYLLANNNGGRTPAIAGWPAGSAQACSVRHRCRRRRTQRPHAEWAHPRAPLCPMVARGVAEGTA